LTEVAPSASASSPTSTLSAESALDLRPSLPRPPPPPASPERPLSSVRAPPSQTAEMSYSQCPCCAGIKVSSSNSVKVVAPEVARRWHPKKNRIKGLHSGDTQLRRLKPSKTSSSSMAHCWLVCPAHGHEVAMQVREACLREKQGRDLCTTCVHNRCAELVSELLDTVALVLIARESAHLSEEEAARQRTWWAPELDDGESEAEAAGSTRRRGMRWWAQEFRRKILTEIPDAAVQRIKRKIATQNNGKRLPHTAALRRGHAAVGAAATSPPQDNEKAAEAETTMTSSVCVVS